MIFELSSDAFAIGVLAFNICISIQMSYPAFGKRVLGVSEAHNKKEKEIKVNYNVKKTPALLFAKCKKLCNISNF